MDKLKRVIQEELSNILTHVDDVDLDSRGRKDRMTKAEDASTDGRWYGQKRDANVPKKVRQIVAETYRQIRDTEGIDIEKKAGIQQFEVSDREDRERWYETEKGKQALEEVAKRAFRKLLSEDTVRARVEAADNVQDLRSAALDLADDLGYELAYEDLVTALDEQSLGEALSSIARHRNL